MPLPGTNPTYTKIDDDNFYLSTTSSTAFNVKALKDEISGHQAIINELTARLAEAEKVGVVIPK